MASSRIPAIIDALLAACSANAGLVGVTVYDGPPTTNETEPDLLFIGASDDQNGDIGFTQDWAGQGSQRRKETFDIPCLAVSRQGGTVMKTSRDRVFTITAAVESLLQADATLGVSGYTVRAQYGTSGSAGQVQSPNGALVRVRFNVHVETRL